MWLRHNVEVAQTRMAKSEPMRLQTERLQDELCRELNLKDIQWDCGWDTTHKIGVLAAFNNLLRQHEDIKHILNDRTLVFGQDSGMSLEGQIILYTGEVRSNWLNVIRNIPNFQASLQHIPLVEKALSQNLRGIKIRRRPNQPLKLVENYKQQLMQLVTNVSDYLSRNKFPEKWPKSLEDYEICVDNESCPLTLSPRGQFIVPSSCPGISDGFGCFDGFFLESGLGKYHEKCRKLSFNLHTLFRFSSEVYAQLNDPKKHFNIFIYLE